jgi:hypothetical protein
LAPPAPQQNGWLPSQEQISVNAAISKGTLYLLEAQDENGSWQGHRPHHVGMAALPALTLLECGVPPDDEHIQLAAHHVRSAAATLHATYEIALSILFLDRLGDPQDEQRIVSLALRLLAGQGEAGGWTYLCPLLPERDERNLLTVLRHRQPDSSLTQITHSPGRTGLSGSTQGQTPAGLEAALSKDGGLKPSADGIRPLAPGDNRNKAANLEQRPSAEEARKALNGLSRGLKQIPALHDSKHGEFPRFEGSDNSNTQFAILGVWVASRHGVPTERALERIARRFRASQTYEGQWGYAYSVPGHQGTPSMTGAGLLGLAVGLGLAVPPENARYANSAPPPDPIVEKGLHAIAQSIGKPLGQAGRRRGRARSDVNLYFLWTLERVGVLYNLREIDGKDWYRWGAELLLDAQNPDGSWSAGDYHGAVPNLDTSFALLFLKRANLVQDLSKRLEFVIDTKRLKPAN